MANSAITLSIKSRQDLLDLAHWFLIGRLDSLEYDVERCLRMEKEGYAPVPALMYCFSVIDLLAALAKGKVGKQYRTKHATQYVNTYMKYPNDKVNLLWNKIYRHKIMHLSFPQVAVDYNGKVISWNLDDPITSNHLTILYQSKSIPIGDGKRWGTIKIDGKFVINIRILKDDIKSSVTRKPDGYLSKLASNINLQNNFRKVIREIYKVDPL